jgi:DNA-binding Lrp family transcriptional regulator
MKKILKLLEKDCTLTADQIASMLGMTAEDVKAAIEKCEKEKIILGYKALIDWDHTEEETVTALIEVKVTPQLGEGFDRIARRIYQYAEVESIYLMSGGYDFAVTISGHSLKEVAQFVALKLAPLEGVTGTATHFILKKYKEKYTFYANEEQQEERVLFV